MNPIDSNVTIRQPRSDTDQGDRAGQATQIETRVIDGGGASVSDASGPDASSAGESVSFTDTAADLLSLENQLRDLPGIDQERVEAIRQAISNGSYEINPEQIVNNLLKSDVELG